MGSLGYAVHETVLDNGLRVIVSPDATAPVVAVNLWCHVGSRDEQRGRTGFAHLFEHLMFQGSTHVGSGEHLAALQAVGGSVNATTSFDRTNYFETVPTGALDLALWLEADRFAGLTIDQHNLDTQRAVVQEEKRQRYDNVPYGDVLEHLLSLAAPAEHPYGHPTIGSMADLDAATLDDVRTFFATHYRAGNLTLALCGDVTPDDAFARAEATLGLLPALPAPGRPDVPPLPPFASRVHEVHAAVPADACYVGWAVPPLTDPDLDRVELALDVLGAGQTSRLHRSLVRGAELAQVAGTSTLELHGGNSLAFASARALPEHGLADVERLLREQIERFATDGPSRAELDRALVQRERDWLSELARVDGRADALNHAAAHEGGPERINTRLDELLATTTDDLRNLAATWLAPDATITLRYLREDQ